MKATRSPLSSPRQALTVSSGSGQSQPGRSLLTHLVGLAAQSPKTTQLRAIATDANAPLQGVFIIGAPLDGSYYNSFQLEQAASLPVFKHFPASALQLRTILAKIDASGEINYPAWAQLEEAARTHLLSESDREDIDAEAFDAALAASGGQVFDEDAIDWQYEGNIAEAATRLIPDDKEESGYSVMIDVNEDDTYPEYDQYDRDIRLGQRTALLIHEMTYHANHEALRREKAGAEDPDVDHRAMFLPGRRNAYLTSFIKAVGAAADPSNPSAVKRCEGIISGWANDMAWHIDEYGRNEAEKAEALEWMEEARDELGMLAQGRDAEEPPNRSSGFEVLAVLDS